MDTFTILTILNALWCLTSLTIWRFIWFYVNYISYAACVELYRKKQNPAMTHQDVSMYMSVWPWISIIPRVWQWDLRNFMVYPELYDEVLKFMREEDKKDDRTN